VKGFCLKDIYIYIENGTFLKAKSFGIEGTQVGEMVFNTSLSGYQEIITDPSYAGQFVVFTMPEVGNVGCNEDDMESKKVFCSGMIIRNYQDKPSNFRSEKSLQEFLIEQNAFGLCDIDTRALTSMIRDEGPKMMVVSTTLTTKDELQKYLQKAPRIEEINYADIVSTKEKFTHKSSVWDDEKFEYKTQENQDTKIVAIDFGVKRNILNELTNVGFEVEVVPHSFNAQELIARYENGEIKGVFLSNGPGDPLVLTRIQGEVKKLIQNQIPLFGICLGHQLLSISNGYPTYKLKFGHHGGNHPVKNLNDQRVEITAQNHNYNVPKELEQITNCVYVNLFDNTVEGVKYKNAPIFSVQHHQVHALWFLWF
jgi:carbamoyl-phosphate synthase small subunit